jgi:hypothetical protein
MNSSYTIGSDTLLDDAFRRISGGEVFDAMEDLLVGLTALRASSTQEHWLSFCRTTLRQHPVFAFVHQAPFTYRAFSKPRGYPGDAVTLDFIYGIEPLPDAGERMATVQRLYAWEFQTPSCRSVRARKTTLAAEIDRASARVPRARVLSLACGHLREAREAEAVLSRQLGSFVAIDQDLESLEVVRSQLASYGVEAVHGSVRGVLARKIRYHNLHLVYAAGLYDYLAEPIATQLTSRLFEMLAPGGRLLVPNFNPSLRDIGYLEGFMDWHLIYRGDNELGRLMSEVNDADVVSRRLFHEKHGNITFLEAVRA